MVVNRKLIRNGNAWALCLNSTILGLLDVNPEVDLINYTMQDNKLIISKSNEKLTLFRENQDGLPIKQ